LSNVTKGYKTRFNSLRQWLNFNLKILSKMKAINKKMVQPSNEVVYVATDSIQSNPSKLGIYERPENFDFIKENISQMGILVPLLVEEGSNEVISGNLRHQIAMELGFDTVPVIYEARIEEGQKTAIAVSTNQFRKKSSTEILKEIRYFEEKFGVKKGQRSDKDPNKKEIKEKRDKSFENVSKNTINKLKSIDKHATNLYGKGTEDYVNAFKSLDNGSKSLNSLDIELKRKSLIKEHNVTIPTTYNYNAEGVTIHCGSSEDMSAVPDKSIQTLTTSSPYFNMRDYQTGKNQLGLESNVDDFINNLVVIFKEAYRVLKDEGSLFVNLNDCCIDGQYQAVPHKFVIKMIEQGWILNDELIWIKNNAQYTRGNRSVRNHEPIFHFVKSKNFYYDTTWMDNLVDKNNAISYGTNAKYPKMFSGVDYVLNDVIRGNISSTGELRKQCSEKGFYLTHSATFPLSIPALCILLSSKEGDKVMDCFSGTATTGEVAIMLGREYIGFETNPEYVMASEVRLSPYFSNAA
jgi:DNA modification methylase